MTDAVNFRPRRSCLYMPGANPRALEKARTLPADTLILDLEDAVAPDAKADARALVKSVLSADVYGLKEIVVRINGIDTLWGMDDLAMVVEAEPEGILAPKVTSAADIRRLDDMLSAAGAAPSLQLWVMIEMPLAILNIHEIAAAAATTRLAGFVMGTNDLAKEMNAQTNADRTAFHYALSASVMAARAFGLFCIDGVYNDFRDPAGLQHECEHGRLLGFDGKTLIHPDQLSIANEVFSPDPADVEQAIAVIAAFDLPENQGKGVIQVNGRMTELLHLEEARKLVAIDTAIRQVNAMNNV
ncbi:MAG: CoA ester lyase [Pseudomonadales bacterium]|nr:CoA ester lyase [Pseudomonadales bacterium]